MIRLDVRDIPAVDRLVEALYVAAGQHSGTARATEWRALAADLEAGLDRLPPQYPTPATPPSKGPAMDQSVIDRWRELTREADHGHLTWTGERATDRRTPVLRIGTRTYPARRIAYRVRHGVDPRGQAKPDCGRPDCIAPAHQTDTTNNQPVHRPHRHYPSAEAKLAALTRPTEDGHLEWTLPGRPYLSFGGINLAPARVAFAAHYGREPVGHVRAGCGTTGCLRGEHLDDRPARVRLAAAMTALGV